MSAAKIAISLNENLLRKLDLMVRERIYPNRSKAIEDAVQDRILRFDRGLLARECAKLDPKEEQALAELGLGTEGTEWPEY